MIRKGGESEDGRCAESVRWAWLEQLLQEFKMICFQYRVQLRSPVFELSAAKRQLGCRLPAQRIIRISEELIQRNRQKWQERHRNTSAAL